ncbi:serine hydrolase [Agrobacterium leguminum]
MEKNGIPGLAVVSVSMVKATSSPMASCPKARPPVTAQTLFELGSISKTFTVTLSTYAEMNGQLSLSGKVEDYFPSMKGKPFGDVTLMQLPPRGFPLQVPDKSRRNSSCWPMLETLIQAGTHRTYANPSIAMLGYITAKAMGQSFDDAMKDVPRAGLEEDLHRVPRQRWPITRRAISEPATRSCDAGRSLLGSYASDRQRRT